MFEQWGLLLVQESPLPISLDNDMETLADIGIVPRASILVDEVQA